MSLFFFVYTIAMLFVCMVAAVFCLATFAVTHRKRYLPQAGFFVFYAIELSSILGNEWLNQNIDVIDASNYYEVDNPVFRIALGAAILACFWFVVLDIIDVHDVRPIAISTVAIIVAQTIALVLLPYGPFRQWLFYTMRQASLLACLLYVLYRWHANNNEVFRQRLSKRRWIYFLMLALVFGVLAEDSFIIFMAPIPSGGSDVAGLYLSSRNISENLMMIVLAYVVVRRAWDELSLRFQKPPEVTEGNDNKNEKRNQDLTGHIEDRLPRYAQDHSLSQRETEVLRLAIKGMSNREIASVLFLAEGTVKTHLHNIMKKCGVTNREELKRSFWAS